MDRNITKAKTIFITEKPSVAREYAKVLKVPSGNSNGYIEGKSPVLGKDVIITWAVGHLVGLCMPEEHDPSWKAWRMDALPIIPDEFRYKVLSATNSQFRVIKSLYTRKDLACIYYAGDSGREGIYIQALIRNQIFKKSPDCLEKVVWIDSFTEESILKGIRDAQPYDNYLPIIESGYARAIDDWLIGLNLSRAFTISEGHGEVIPVGRVMTPTLSMVVKRQEEIDHFVKTDFYGVRADAASWKAVKSSKYFDSPLLYNENGFRSRRDALRLCNECGADMSLTVEDVKVQTKKQYAPYLFNLADLQAYCSKSYHISPAQTLKIAQSLYEKKYTTYPRTDSRFLSTAVQKDLEKKYGYRIPQRYVDDSKIVDHYAIIPTFEGDARALTGLEQSVYMAIYKRIMDTMKPPFIYDAVSIQYVHTNGEKFFESYRIVKQKGFKEKIEEDDISDKPAPKKGDRIPVHAYTVKSMETKAPTPYTTGTLILAMEKAGKLVEDEELREQIKTCGIGTSATRAEIVDKLIRDKLIIADKKQKITPTEKGKTVISLISRYDESIISPIKTADMEQQLRLIAEARLSRDRHKEDIANYLKGIIGKIMQNYSETSIGRCPHCGGNLVEGNYGLYCANNCGMRISKVFSHVLSRDEVLRLLNHEPITFTENGRTTKVLPEVVVNEWNGGTYYNWKTESGGANGSVLGTCPHCGGTIVTGTYGAYCRNNCGMRPANIYKTRLTNEQVVSLLNGRPVTIQDNGQQKTVLPEIVANEWNGKTYYNWKSADAGNVVFGKCPKCGGDVVKGKFGAYCKNKCGMNISRVFGYTLSDDNVRTLLAKGVIRVITNGRNTTVFPEISYSEKDGKVYYNWRTEG